VAIPHQPIKKFNNAFLTTQLNRRGFECSNLMTSLVKKRALDREKCRKMEVGATGQTIRLSDVLKFDESLTEIRLFRAELTARIAIRTT